MEAREDSKHDREHTVKQLKICLNDTVEAVTRFLHISILSYIQGNARLVGYDPKS